LSLRSESDEAKNLNVIKTKRREAETNIKKGEAKIKKGRAAHPSDEEAIAEGEALIAEAKAAIKECDADMRKAAAAGGKTLDLKNLPGQKGEGEEPGTHQHPVMDREDRRECTLCLCLGTDWPGLLVFFCMLGSCLGLWAYSFSYGQPDIAIYGMAWNGNVCGQSKFNTADARFNVWINPTMTSSIFASSVCMPSCPNITKIKESTYNSSTAVSTINSLLDSPNITDATLKANAKTNLNAMNSKLADAQAEVKYMTAQLGDSANELDKTSVFCLCNAKKFPSFTSHNHGEYGKLCNATPAVHRGYVELKYSSALDTFLGNGRNLMFDKKSMDKVPCAYKFRTFAAYTRCMPWITANTLGKITKVQGAAGIGDVVSSYFNAAGQTAVNISTDIEKGQSIVIAGCAIALGICIILIFLMSCRFNPTGAGPDEKTGEPAGCKLLACIVWGLLLIVFVMFICVTAVCAYYAKLYKDKYDTVPELTTKANDETQMWIFGIGACVGFTFTLVHFCFCCCFREEISNAIEIIVAASETLESAWGLLLYPVLHNTAVAIAIVCWIIGLVFIGTCGTKAESTTGVTELSDSAADGVMTLTYDEGMQKVMAYYFFCIIWIIEWFGALGYMITAGAILIPFFDHYEPKEGSDEKVAHYWCPVFSSFGLIVCNHMGTAAIGSFFITLVVILRIIATYFLEQAKANAGEDNKLVQYAVACIQCCLQCVEDCMRYMVNTAYILTVLEGRWFFSAVCGGLKMIWDNLAQIAATNYLSFIIITLCKLAVPLIAVGCSHLMIKSGNYGVTESELSSAFHILVPVLLVSLIFSFTFMGLLDTSIEVCLVAFCKLEAIEADLSEEDKDKYNVMSCVPGGIKAIFLNKDSALADKYDPTKDGGDTEAGPEVEMEGNPANAADDV
jgi:hypothetical protein